MQGEQRVYGGEREYPSAPSCSGQTASCLICHVALPELNASGLDDGDGAKNLEEILQGTWPGDPARVPTTLPTPSDAQGVSKRLTGRS